MIFSHAALDAQDAGHFKAISQLIHAAKRDHGCIRLRTNGTHPCKICEALADIEAEERA